MSKKIAHSIPCGIGDFIMVRSFFDTIKDQFEEIRISPSQEIMTTWRNNDQKYWEFLNKLGPLLFSDYPYVFDNERRELTWPTSIINEYSIKPIKPELSHLLCRGSSLNINEPYIVIFTKIRYLSKNIFNSLSSQFWNIIIKLSKKYKIVIMGEREIEYSKEYLTGENINQIYCIYDQIISNISIDRIIDLTIPSLGITAPDLCKIQQDCLIIKQALFVITIGVGGSFCMTISVASKIIGFRQDNEQVVDMIFNKDKYIDTCIITRDWNKFVQILEQS